jgi:hypothetical protein
VNLKKIQITEYDIYVIVIPEAMADGGEAKSFLYAWLGKMKSTPDYSVRTIGKVL